MGLIDVKYMMAEGMTAEERKELDITTDTGLIAVETTNSDLKVKGVEVKSYVERLLNLGD